MEEKMLEGNRTSPREPGGKQTHWVILNRSPIFSLEEQNRGDG